MRCLLLGIPLLAACSIGPRVTRFAPIRDPQGAQVQVTRGRNWFMGELLAASDTALLVLNTRSAHIVSP